LGQIRSYESFVGLIPTNGFAEADLHNLWPAIGAINSSRQDKLLGEIRAETRTLPPNLLLLTSGAFSTSAGETLPVISREIALIEWFSEHCHAILPFDSAKTFLFSQARSVLYLFVFIYSRTRATLIDRR
jgi:hypothetical protein